jgi:hypothetical protein
MENSFFRRISLLGDSMRQIKPSPRPARPKSPSAGFGRGCRTKGRCQSHYYVQDCHSGRGDVLKARIRSVLHLAEDLNFSNQGWVFALWFIRQNAKPNRTHWYSTNNTHSTSHRKLDQSSLIKPGEGLRESLEFSSIGILAPPGVCPEKHLLRFDAEFRFGFFREVW